MSSNRQFPQQLTMFERTQDVIDHVHKIDAPEHIVQGLSPREQWEAPHPMTGVPLRDKKLAAIDKRGATWDYQGKKYDLRGAAARGMVPPMRIQHVNDEGDDMEPELWDGHHRLALLESLGHTEVPVYHSFDDETHPQWFGQWDQHR